MRWILLQIRLLNGSREEMSTGQQKDMDWAWLLQKVFQRPAADTLISLLMAICLKLLSPIHYIGKIDSCLTCSCKNACFLI